MHTSPRITRVEDVREHVFYRAVSGRYKTPLTILSTSNPFPWTLDPEEGPVLVVMGFDQFGRMRERRLDQLGIVPEPNGTELIGELYELRPASEEEVAEAEREAQCHTPAFLMKAGVDIALALLNDGQRRSTARVHDVYIFGSLAREDRVVHDIDMVLVVDDDAFHRNLANKSYKRGTPAIITKEGHPLHPWLVELLGLREVEVAFLEGWLRGAQTEEEVEEAKNAKNWPRVMRRFKLDVQVFPACFTQEHLEAFYKRNPDSTFVESILPDLRRFDPDTLSFGPRGVAPFWSKNN